MRYGTRWNVASGDTEEWIADALAAAESMGEDERGTLRRLAEAVDVHLEAEYEQGLADRDYDVWFDEDLPDPPAPDVSKSNPSDGDSR